MPDRNDYAPGTPNWVDLQTSDQAGAKRFYSELFGWEYDDQPVGDGVYYSLASIRGRHVGAIAPLPADQAAQGVPPHWNTYVSVADVDATAARVAAAHGTVIAPPFDAMDAGRMAVIQDPTGAVLLLWQAKNHIGAGIVNEHGALSWNELLSPDVASAAAFYAQLFGWEARPVEGMDYTEFRLNGQPIAGAMKPPMEGIPPNWGIYFAVDDCDATVAKAKSFGAAVFAEPTDIPPGRFAVLADPGGAVFSVIKLAQPAQ